MRYVLREYKHTDCVASFAEFEELMNNYSSLVSVRGMRGARAALRAAEAVLVNLYGPFPEDLLIEIGEAGKLIASYEARQAYYEPN